jgi:hypothetical protein
MSTETLDRIVDCAHFAKITSPADLSRETRWNPTVEDGECVLSLITTHKPIPPLEPVAQIANTPTRPLNSITNTSGTPGASSSKPPHRCGNCMMLGHITPNRACPKYQPQSTPHARASPCRDENLVPMPALQFLFNAAAV